MIALDFKKSKQFFFDRQAVIDRIGKDRAKFLRNVGRYVQRVARSSMKRRGKARKPPANMTGKAYQNWLNEIQNQPASPPGKPPFVHTDSDFATLKNILFAMSSTESVMVGPVGLRSSNAPSLHEFGGSQTIGEKLVSFTDETYSGPAGRDSSTGRFTKGEKTVVKGRRWVPRGKRGVRPGQPTRKRRAGYPARPFIGPAVQKAASTGKFKDLWHTSASSMGAA